MQPDIQHTDATLQPAAPGVFKRVTHGMQRGALAQGIPSRPLLGKLPLARLIPQDVHSLADYGTALGHALCAIYGRSPTARIAAWALGGSVAGISLLTDYRLSLAKVVPIEVHEAADYVSALGSILAPFVFGYRKTAPGVAFTQILLGIGVIAASLVTDYRAQKGVRWTKASAF